MAVVLTVMKLVMRRLLILRLLTALPWCLPMTSPDPSLTFTGENSGYAELQEVPVDGTLSVSLSFRTAAREGLLLYMRETSTGHHVSLSISDGALSLQVYPDTNIVLVTEDTREKVRVDDNQWHKVFLSIKEAWTWHDITIRIDSRRPKTEHVRRIPLLQDANYETFLGGLPSSLREKVPADSYQGEATFVGCIKDIILMDSAIVLEDIQISGGAVGDCDDLLPRDSRPVFTGWLTGVVSGTEETGTVVMTVRAEDRHHPVSLELVENPGGYFALDSVTGQLSIARQIDLEVTGDVLQVTVKASQIVDGQLGKSK